MVHGLVVVFVLAPAQGSHLRHFVNNVAIAADVEHARKGLRLLQHVADVHAGLGVEGGKPLRIVRHVKAVLQGRGGINNRHRYGDAK
jgi:hypothetical protein